MTVIHCVANGQRKKRFFVAGRHVLPAAKAVKKTQGRVREGRSFAAASGGNRRSGSPMSKGVLQAVAQRAIEGREAAGAPRTQGKAESAGAEHRAAEGEHGAKMPDDYCELWAQGRAASALCAHRRPEGLEWRAHGAKRSAQPRNTGPLKAARCEGAERPC